MLSIRETIAKYKLEPKKNLGQNFLIDSYITDQIVSYIPNLPSKTILEIGPGPGALTRSILNKNPKKLYAVEIDERCLESLKELQLAFPDKLEVLYKDALHLDLAEFTEKLDIIANLPYNIATALLLKWYLEYDKLNSITVMIQKEVAERITSGPGSKQFGRLSIISQIFTEPHILFDVPPEFFMPSPRVVSSVVYFKVREKPLKVDLPKLELLLDKLFTKRRKMLRVILPSKSAKIVALGIDDSKRPEQLTIDEIIKISELL